MIHFTAWNTDPLVLLRLATCHNIQNACLLCYALRMKFTRFFAAGSIDLLNLRLSIRALPCAHCDCRESVVAHGYLRGLADSGHEIVTRGVRFFAPTVIQI